MTVERVGKKLRTAYKVRGFHIDVNGHVHNAEYMRFAEMARDDFLDYLGLSPPALMKQGLRLVIAESRLRFRQPAYYGDVLEVWGWLEELGRARTMWRQEICRAGDGAVLTEITLRVAMLDDEGRIIAVPPAIRAVLDSVLVKE